MEAIRKVIEHSTNPLKIELPEEFTNRKTEVIVLPVEEKKRKKEKQTSLHFLANWNGKATR